MVMLVMTGTVRRNIRGPGAATSVDSGVFQRFVAGQPLAAVVDGPDGLAVVHLDDVGIGDFIRRQFLVGRSINLVIVLEKEIEICFIFFHLQFL